MLHKHNLIGVHSLFLVVYRILVLWNIIKKNFNKIFFKSTIMEEDTTYNLMDLSDYSLLHIFKYLSSSDLYNLSSMCKRLKSLVEEKNFWYQIDTRAATSNTLRKVKYCLEKVNEQTKHLLICGQGRDRKGLPMDAFTKLSYPRLTVLALENLPIYKDIRELAKQKCKERSASRLDRSVRPKSIIPQPKMSHYPKGLVELSLRKTFVQNCEKFFKFSHTHMENLKVLILDECCWVETQMLVPISKYPKLEVLSLYRCKKLSDCDIAYISLAGSYGFTKLRILDVRFTGLGDQILKTFYKHRTLQELYFQDYTTTYALDRAKRRLAIAQGAPIKQHPYFSPYDDIPDCSTSRMRKLFKCSRLTRRNMQTVTDQGAASYNSVKPDLEATHKVRSVLYRRPHAECGCGYIFGAGKTAMRNAQTSPLDNGSEEISKLKRIIELEETLGKQRKIVCGLSRAEHWMLRYGKRDPCNDYEMALFEHMAPEFTDFCALKTETDQELTLERKIMDSTWDPELTLWDLYGINASPDVEEDSKSESEDPDKKAGCNKRKFSADSEDGSDASDGRDWETNSDDTDDDNAQGNPSTSQQKSRRGNKRRRDDNGEPRFKTFVLSPGGESNAIAPRIKRCNWVRPMYNHMEDAPKVAIRKLSLRGYPGITDHCLHFLSDLKLDLLDVTGTGVTQNGLTHFFLTNPQCRVLHESACTCPIDVHF